MGLLKSIAFATIIVHVGCLEGFRGAAAGRRGPLGHARGEIDLSGDPRDVLFTLFLLTGGD